MDSSPIATPEPPKPTEPTVIANPDPDEEPPLYFAAEIDLPTAQERLRPPRGLGAWLSPGRRRHLEHVERVWMPFALFIGQAVHGSKSTTLRCMVDRCNGETFALAAEPRTVAAVPDEERLEPRNSLSFVACQLLAQSFLRRFLMAQRGPSRQLTMHQSHACYYPFWAGYFRRRKTKLDVRLLDAVTGKRTGAGIRRAFLSTILEAADEEASRAPDAHSPSDSVRSS